MEGEREIESKVEIAKLRENERDRYIKRNDASMAYFTVQFIQSSWHRFFPCLNANISTLPKTRKKK